MTISFLPALRFERQALPGMCAITAAMETLASAGVEARGAIFTRREVVDFILDLVGYTIDRPLHRLRLLEPSFGGGDFLLPAIDRLLSVWTRDRGIECLSHAIRAVEIHSISFTETRAAVLERLRAAGLHDAEAVVAYARSDKSGVSADANTVSADGSANVPSIPLSGELKDLLTEIQARLAAVEAAKPKPLISRIFGRRI